MNKGIFPFLVFLCSLFPAQQKPVRIAFLSDVHFQDLYGSFSDTSFKGIINPGTGKPTILRTMDSQLHSTRIFNENYFAFLKALDDIVAKGIQIVAMPGDFSDDGQAYNLRGLRKILDQYHQKYGMRFYLTTGNHDPVGPFHQEAGKEDFLGPDGYPLGIYSKQKHTGKSPEIVTKDIAASGYLEILDELKDFGFCPGKDDLFWSTPFAQVSPDSYSYAQALKKADCSHRMYEVEPGFAVPDLSYVAEPVQGIWMIAIDGNAYLPKDLSASPKNPSNYKGAGIGYNNVLTHKKHLIPWVKKLTAEAKKYGKTIIAFTHYPMTDFNDGASPELKKLLGSGKWQLERVPDGSVAKAFAEAGLQVHFAGHMHINDTGILKTANHMLVNIQVPSLAAYLPAYKVLTVKSRDKMEVQTEVLDAVPRFNELFPLYEKEYQALQNSPVRNLWDREILKTKSYHDFMLFHLKELVRLRMVPGDWPRDFIRRAEVMDGKDLLLMAENGKQSGKNGIDPEEYKTWNFKDLILDVYKFQSADELARKDIPGERLKQYHILEELYRKTRSADPFVLQMASVFRILTLLSGSDPAGHFEIDLKAGKIKRL